METEVSRPFSSFGAGRVVIKPGSDRFVPILPSSIGFQPNQMPASHSNHQAQFSDEIHGVFNPLHRNIHIGGNFIQQPYFNLNGLQAKPPNNSGVSVEKMGPPHDSLHSCSSTSGGNGEAISPSSDEAENQHVIDERKQRRMLSNRESARRSRMRKQQHLDELKAQVAQLRAENGHILNKFNITSQHYAHISEENCMLRSHALELSHKLQQLHHIMNAQSYTSFRTLGIENGHCNAVSLCSESGNMDQFIASSDLLF